MLHTTRPVYPTGKSTTSILSPLPFHTNKVSVNSLRTLPPWQLVHMVVFYNVPACVQNKTFSFSLVSLSYRYFSLGRIFYYSLTWMNVRIRENFHAQFTALLFIFHFRSFRLAHSFMSPDTQAQHTNRITAKRYEKRVLLSLPFYFSPLHFSDTITFSSCYSSLLCSFFHTARKCKEKVHIHTYILLSDKPLLQIFTMKIPLLVRLVHAALFFILVATITCVACNLIMLVVDKVTWGKSISKCQRKHHSMPHSLPNYFSLSSQKKKTAQYRNNFSGYFLSVYRRNVVVKLSL